MIINCKECRSHVSDQAYVCPSCGTTLRKRHLVATPVLRRLGSTYFWPTFFIGAGIAGVWAVFGDAHQGSGAMSIAYGMYLEQLASDGNVWLAWLAGAITTGLVAVPVGLFVGIFGLLTDKK